MKISILHYATPPTIGGVESPKQQGFSRVVEYYRENPVLLQKLEDYIMQCLQPEKETSNAGADSETETVGDAETVSESGVE